MCVCVFNFCRGEGGGGNYDYHGDPPSSNDLYGDGKNQPR